MMYCDNCVKSDIIKSAIKHVDVLETENKELRDEIARLKMEIGHSRRHTIKRKS